MHGAQSVDHTVAAVSIYLGHDDADAHNIRPHVQEGGVFVYPPPPHRKERAQLFPHAPSNNEKNVKKYWDKYEKYVYDWFKPENRKRTTVLISASPDFLIEEIARRMNVDYVICTTHDRKHGIMRSEVCRHAEKVRRFREVLPDAEVMDVYSDSIKSDRYIFALGKRDFLVTKGKIEEFNLDEKLKEMNLTL